MIGIQGSEELPIDWTLVRRELVELGLNERWGQ